MERDGKVGGREEASPQFAAQFHAVLGRESQTWLLADKGSQSRPPAAVALDDLQMVDALDEIASASRGYRVVILSENHDSQRERAFAHLLAVKLKSEGFTHIGAETLSPDAGKTLKQDGPTLKSGFYTIDPLFADFLRQAVNIGYVVFDYEQRVEQETAAKDDFQAELVQREQSEAENIVKVLKSAPDSRLLLYVGGSHGAKTLQQKNLAMMGRLLGETAGLQVLSIAQWGTPRSKTEYDHPLHQAVSPSLPADGNTMVFRRREGGWLAPAGFDMMVFHPRAADFQGRAGWMAMQGYRKPYVVTLAPLPSRTLLRARLLPLRVGEIAMDQVLVDAGETKAALFLPVGEYELFREGEDGITEKWRRVKIK